MDSDLCDNVPELKDILRPRSHQRSTAPCNLRRSPRKTTSSKSQSVQYQHENVVEQRVNKHELPNRHIAEQSRSNNRLKPVPIGNLFDNLPVLPRYTDTTIDFATSENKSSPKNVDRPVRFPHVDSLLLPLSRIALQERNSNSTKGKDNAKIGRTRRLSPNDSSPMSLMTEAARKPTAKPCAEKLNKSLSYTSRFVLTEAQCNDDKEDSILGEEDDEEDTDLSGFIVDDAAELSYHDTSASDSDNRYNRNYHKRNPPQIKRRLFRGSRPVRHCVSGLENIGIDMGEKKTGDSATKFDEPQVDNTKSKHRHKTEIEVVDLTSSPAMSRSSATNEQYSLRNKPVEQGLETTRLVKDFEAILRLSPSVEIVPPVTTIDSQIQRFMDYPDHDQAGIEDQTREVQRPTTPAVTPPVSPTKLKSPTKLLSPSKRGNYVHGSPHRQSTDAFWDLQTVNEWADQYSPRKVPTASPKKGLSRFNIWSDSDSEVDDGVGSSESLPSPCSSPRKMDSPMKSPEKAEKMRKAAEKKLSMAQKKAFITSRERFAQDLLIELDKNIADGQLSKLSASTGGVKVIWSKTLRSTAGRANWRRTVTKPSGSPVKGAVTEGPGIRVEHYASIELAEKVIDCEDRLVNTLAHEFCHLANFMVSGIRDQPHGTSFKKWAAKATKHLRNSDNQVWQKVEVTTKHNYVINHKYLWACVGRETTKAMEFLNLEDAEGCGAEYGRHSKSIDIEKQRCGKCKGRLVQVRPKPRASPVKKVPARILRTTSSQGSGSGISALGEMIDIIELSD